MRKRVLNEGRVDMSESYKIGQEIFDKEIAVLNNVRNQLGSTFDHMVDELMGCTGKVIFIGMGKSGHVAKKIAATMSSLGICSICLHPGECMHGDLGMIQRQDVVVLISYSGESDEILKIIPGINKIGAILLGITCNGDSSLVRACRYVQVMDGVKEACHIGLAPTSSTTAVMVYGDALAITISKLKGFQKDDFGAFHPAGSLGKKLITRAIDLMHPIRMESCVYASTTMYDALQFLIETDTDMIPVIDVNQQLVGIVTNGDLKRKMKENINIREVIIESILHKYPYYVDDSAMAVEALEVMVNNGVHALPVVRNGRPVGIIEKNDVVKYGIYI